MQSQPRKIINGSFLYFAGFFFLGLTLWTKKFIGYATADQVISLFIFNVKGVFVNNLLIFRFLEYCFIGPLLLTVGMLKLETFISKTKIDSRKSIYKFGKIIPLILIGVGITTTVNRFDLVNCINYLMIPPDKVNADYFAQDYIDPGKSRIYTNNPKSLVLIYVESLESTYSNKKIFGRDLLAALNNLKTDSIQFNQFEQTEGADWTIAGVVASQCGIPLKFVSDLLRNRQFKHVKKFLPNSTCLSDILAAHGYKNVFLKGASLNFAGFGTFLNSHHYAERYGKHEWLAQGFKTNQLNLWGLPDDLLFEQAKHTLARLIKNKQQFNLSILTVDTHGINGELNKTCAGRGAKNFEDIVECTATEVAEFVQYIEAQNWLDQVTVVIMGDHRAMENEVSDKLRLSENRYIFNLIVGKNLPSKSSDIIIHFDWLPTILHALGFSFPENKLALGRSALGDAQFAENFEQRMAKLHQIARYRSRLYDELWIPQSTVQQTSRGMLNVSHLK